MPAPTREAARGERAFDEVYTAHRQGLHAYFLGRTNDPEAALDLVQEAFLRAWRNLPLLVSLAPERRRYWLFRVAKNLVTDHYRRQAVRAPWDGVADAAPDPAAPASDRPEVRAETREALHRVSRAIAALPEELRTPLIMQVLGEMPSGRIGEVLGEPAGTIRYRISRARQLLARELQATDEGRLTVP